MFEVSILLVAGFVFVVLLLARSGDGRKRTKKQLRHSKQSPQPSSKFDLVRGRAFVIDGDSIRCRSLEIRMDGIDAPEHDQIAYNQKGKIIRVGALAKSSLIKKIGGKEIEVRISKTDHYGRKVGTVYCEGEDINLWLVT